MFLYSLNILFNNKIHDSCYPTNDDKTTAYKGQPPSSIPMLTISLRSWVWTLAAPTLAQTVYSLIEYFSMTFNRCVIHKNLLLGFQNYATALKLLVAECHNWSDHARPVMHVFPCNDVQIYARACIFFQLLCHAILISVLYGITEFQKYVDRKRAWQ